MVQPYYCYNDATVQPVHNVHIVDDETREDCVLLLVGPTGAGKSRFVEALAGDDSLGISKDQLDSVTQQITAYEVLPNSEWYGVGEEIMPFIRQHDSVKIILLDTPGFSDSQISELEIVEMVREWMRVHNCGRIHYMFYFCPITDIRLTRSRQRTIGMLKSLCRIDGDAPGDLIVATTMWDRLSNERSRTSAEARHEQLRTGIWKDLVDGEGCFTKFLNTRESAVDVLHQLLVYSHTNTTRTRHATIHSNEVEYLREAPCSPPLYEDLLDRIQSALQNQQVLREEMAKPEMETNHALKLLTGQQLQRNTRLLNKFETQLIKFGDPPVGFEDAAPMRQAIMEEHKRQSVYFQDIMDRIKMIEQQKTILEWELAEPEAASDPTFKTYTEQRLCINERLLTKFETELLQFGDPPSGFEDSIPIRLRILEKHQRRASKDGVAVSPPATTENHVNTPRRHNQDQASIAGSSGSPKLKGWVDKGLRSLGRKHRK